MSITDELREYAGSFYLFRYKDVREKLDAIADRIDAEHERQLGVLYRDMSDAEWVRLPVDGEAPSKQLADWIERRGLVTGPLDADGELWHSGDMSDSNWGVIEGIAYEDGRWFVSGHDTSAPWIPADSIRHYHAPTVEDVLTEFGIDWEYEGNCEDRAALLKEYAKRLTLAGDAE